MLVQLVDASLLNTLSLSALDLLHGNSLCCVVEIEEVTILVVYLRLLIQAMTFGCLLN